jgi:hypothetical protein
MPRPPRNPSSAPLLIVVFDLRDPEAAVTLIDQRGAWHGCASEEILDGDHHVLVIRPGGARRLLRKPCEG